MQKKIVLLSSIIYISLTSICSSAESGGMPQLDPEFWVSQIFWLILTFGFLFIILSKLILPNISKSLETRKSQILDNIEIADKQRDDSEKKIKEYENIIFESKNEARNIINEAKQKVIEDLKNKKTILEKEINNEIMIVENEINELKKRSPEKINQIAIDASSDLLKQLVGIEVNKSSISAIVEDLSKKNKERYYDI